MMPGASVTVDVDVEARIAEVVAARGPMLEQLVRERVHASSRCRFVRVDPPSAADPTPWAGFQP